MRSMTNKVKKPTLLFQHHISFSFKLIKKGLNREKEERERERERAATALGSLGGSCSMNPNWWYHQRL